MTEILETCLSQFKGARGKSVVDLYPASAILHGNKTFCLSSFAVRNLRTSLDGQKKKLFVHRGLNMADV